VSEIEAEVERLSQRMWRMLARGGDYVSEVPYAIHSRGPDTGGGQQSIRLHGRGEAREAHDGLGGPEFHPRFLAYLKDSGTCLCPETKPDGTPQPHLCDRRFEGTAKVREPRHETHPRRLKRAFRQLRLLAPYDQYHLVFLVVARGRAFPQAMEQVNAARIARGEMPLTQQEAAIMLVAGTDLLQMAW
jgi:hypothetical protein